MRYEVQIGSNYNLGTQKEEPAVRLEISEEQLAILVRFADLRRDEELNELYVINSCSFKIVPVLETNYGYSNLPKYTI